jgi:3-hydroxyacyl-CoA dehydrogenase/enoyl-CoA hydratase/3-hydroxybutyryl-CoA epimerase
LLWPGLADLFAAEKQAAAADLAQRLLAAQREEAARCLEEGIAPDAAAANVSSVFAWGFPPDTGGVLADA